MVVHVNTVMTSMFLELCGYSYIIYTLKRLGQYTIHVYGLVRSRIEHLVWEKMCQLDIPFHYDIPYNIKATYSSLNCHDCMEFYRKFT